MYNFNKPEFGNIRLLLLLSAVLICSCNAQDKEVPNPPELTLTPEQISSALESTGMPVSSFPVDTPEPESPRSEPEANSQDATPSSALQSAVPDVENVEAMTQSQGAVPVAPPQSTGPVAESPIEEPVETPIPATVPVLSPPPPAPDSPPPVPDSPPSVPDTTTTVPTDVSEGVEPVADTPNEAPDSQPAEPVVSGLIPLYDTSVPSLSVLFIGNSYLSHRPYVDGVQTDYTVAKQFIDLAKVDIPDVQSTVKHIPGGTLQQHWDQGNAPGSARAELASGNYQLLVIQGRYDILEDDGKRQRFDDYADRFATLANASGVTIVFYGLWATDWQISAAGGDTFGPEANRIYCAAATRHGAGCAPNGLAYNVVYQSLAQTMDDNSIGNLLTVDQIHPYPPVAYMAANVLYATVFGKMAPSLSVYRPPNTNDSIGSLMRQAAWSATTNYALNGN